MSTRKPAPGRPPRAGTASTHVLRVRLTPDEAELARAKADAAGLTLSQWARRKLGLAGS